MLLFSFTHFNNNDRMCFVVFNCRSTQLDSWTWQQLRGMQVGGNAAAVSAKITIL